MMPSRDPGLLLDKGECGVPDSVRRTSQLLRDLKVWHVFSRNPPVRSCKEAAAQRYRLGCRGIPLCDEMKSYFGLLESDSKRSFIAVHCRGDRELELDLLALRLAKSGTVTRLSKEELSKLGMAYGLVNPFADYVLDPQILSAPIMQVFDKDLLNRSKSPSTVMTNAGDLTWAVEFDATQLFEALSVRESGGDVRIESISAPDANSSPRLGNSPPAPEEDSASGRGGRITIVTGNAPESGLSLAENLFQKVRENFGNRRLGDVAMPETEILSLPGMGLSMELDIRQQDVWDVIHASLERSLRAGSKTIALACHTTQFFAPQMTELCKEVSGGCKFLSMAETTADWLRKNQFERVGLIGIRYVAELAEYSAYKQPFAGIEVETPDSATLGRISELAYRVKTDGVTQPGLARLRDLIRGSVQCDDIILALTELSLLKEQLRHKKGRSEKNLIDPLDMYAQALADRFTFGDPVGGDG
jgi:aspartate/glutamate racemase